MLFKFIESDGNDADSLATIQAVNLEIAPQGVTGKVPLWLLGSAFDHVPHFAGFLPGQHFEIDVKAVTVKHHDTVEPVTDGSQAIYA